MFQKKPSASEVDGVQYRRAKLWQIICYACNAFVGMSVYSLIGMASYFLPGVGEFADIGWAFVSALVFHTLFGGRFGIAFRVYGRL